MLDVLAILAASFNVLYALLLAVGLDQMGHAGRPLMSVFAGVFLLSAPATVYAVVQVTGDGSQAWLAMTCVPPLSMVALQFADPDTLWGNFPPPPAQRVLQRIAAVAVFALPAVLAWAAV